MVKDTPMADDRIFYDSGKKSYEREEENFNIMSITSVNGNRCWQRVSKACCVSLSFPLRSQWQDDEWRHLRLAERSVRHFQWLTRESEQLTRFWGWARQRKMSTAQITETRVSGWMSMQRKISNFTDGCSSTTSLILFNCYCTLTKTPPFVRKDKQSFMSVAVDCSWGSHSDSTKKN